MADWIEFIPNAGACIASKNVISGAGRVRWMVRDPSNNPADNGWRILSSIDDDAYLADSKNMQVVDFNQVCEIEPALIGIWNLPVGSDLELIDERPGLRIVDSRTGRDVPLD